MKPCRKTLTISKKKIDSEALRSQDTKHIQEYLDKWNYSESKLTEVSSNIETLFKGLNNMKMIFWDSQTMCLTIVIKKWSPLLTSELTTS